MWNKTKVTIDLQGGDGTLLRHKGSRLADATLDCEVLDLHIF